MNIEGGFLRSRVARRIVALFVLSALIPIAALAVLAFGHVRNVLVQQGHAQLARLSESYGSTLYDRLLAIDHQVRSMTASYAPAMRFSPDVEQRLRMQFDVVAVRAADGGVQTLLGTAAEVPEPSATMRRHFDAGETALATRFDKAGQAHVYMLRPIESRRAHGEVLVAEIRPGYLWGEAGTFPAFTDFCIIDDGTAVLFCTDTPVPDAIRTFARQTSRSAAGHFEFEDKDGKALANFREVFMAPRFFVHGWTVVAARPEDEMLAAIGAFKKVFVPTVAVALLLVALLSLNQVRRTLVPLERLIEGTRRAANKDFTVRVEVRGQDEFGELAASFNSMAARLGSQFTALMTLADIDRAILSRLDVDRVLETVVTRMREIVPADYVSIAVLDRNATDMLRIYTRDQRGERALEIERSTCAPDQAKALLAHPEGQWLDGAAPETPYTAPVRRLGAAALFVLPIVWKDAAIGAVVLGFAAAAMLTDEERARARDLGDRVGVAFATAAKDEQLYYQAHYDSLTQLPNRLYFKDQLARRVAQSQRDRKRFALLFIDLDHFKIVNDSFGHAEGDEVLTQAADRLRQCVREADAVARLGGDEFTIIVSDLKAARDAELVANHIIKAMSAPFEVGAQQHYLNASIGMAIYPADGSTVDELLRNADTAMYRAKEKGRGRAVYFEERMNAAAQARVTFERDMRQAIESNQFVLMYQPQVDLASGRVAGAEALIRWNHPQRGLLSPLNFIQLAEDTGLIEPLGEWVLWDACMQYVAWQGQGIDLPRVSVNVSPRQFRQKTFLATVTRVLEETGMRPEALELEITESLLMDAARDVEITLGKLASAGIRLAMDDFGTGYSSLAYLKRFPFDIVKIDRAFIKDLPGDESSGAITSAIVAMTHALHKEVVAEGVAEADQAAFLRRLGCDLIQGYHVSRPVTAEDLAEFVLRSDPAHVRAPAVAA